MDNKQYLTPRPKVKEPDAVTMNFPDAIRKIMEGKKVRRISWPSGDYGFLKDEWLTIYTKGAFHQWLVSDGDMIDAEDWVVMEGN